MNNISTTATTIPPLDVPDYYYYFGEKLKIFFKFFQINSHQISLPPYSTPLLVYSHQKWQKNGKVSYIEISFHGPYFVLGYSPQACSPTWLRRGVILILLIIFYLSLIYILLAIN